jgi:phage terminase large subunit GpA-like protein
MALKTKVRKVQNESELLQIVSDAEFAEVFTHDRNPDETSGPQYLPSGDVASMVDWAERNVVFSPRVPTAKPGPWRSDTVPAMCAKGGPLDVLEDGGIEKIAVMKGSQTAMTTTAYVWLVRVLSQEPASALIVMNSGRDAVDKARESWMPMIEDSPALAPMMPVNKREQWTKTYQVFNRAAIYWTGANSAGALGSKPIRYLVLDEVDKYPQQFGRSKGTKAKSSSEAGAVQLATQRTKTYSKSGRAKILMFSTPTDDMGEIAMAYEAGDKRHLYVKCHSCGGEQVMVWKHFKIDMKLAVVNPQKAMTEAHYQCQHCRALWSDKDRYNAIAAGEWRPTCKPRNPKSASFWLPSWLSPFVTTEYLAAKWIAAQGNKTGIHDFINSECGEPYVHFENSIRSSTFSKLEGDYAEGTRWTDCETYKGQLADDSDPVVFAGVDVQKGYLMVTFRTFIRKGDSGLLWNGTVSDFTELDRMADQYQAQYVLIDQRYRTREVQEFCFSRAGYIPCEGVKTRARSIYAVNSLDLDEGKSSRTGLRVIETLSHDGDQLKDILAGMIQGTDPGERRWMVPKGYADREDYCAQMSAERCINGKWVNPLDRANHAWDSEVLCLLAAIRFGYFGRMAQTERDE